MSGPTVSASLLRTIAVATACALGAVPAAASEDEVGGRSIVVFPGSDQVEAAGFPKGDRVTVEVLRGDVVISRAQVDPADDPDTPGFDGIVSVNHEGDPGCWEAITPDIRAGDVVRARSVGGLLTQTAAALIAIDAPPAASAGFVTIRGRASGPDGRPASLPQIEVTLVNGDDRFSRNRRKIRTGREGSLAVDASGVWIATFRLGESDTRAALAADVEVAWKGNDPATEREATVLELGAKGGPVRGCTAPPEGPPAPVPSAPVPVVPPVPAPSPQATRVVSGAPESTPAQTAGGAAIAARIRVAGRYSSFASARCATRRGVVVVRIARLLEPAPQAARLAQQLPLSGGPKGSSAHRVLIALRGVERPLANARVTLRRDRLGGSFRGRDRRGAPVVGTFVC